MSSPRPAGRPYRRGCGRPRLGGWRNWLRYRPAELVERVEAGRCRRQHRGHRPLEDRLRGAQEHADYRGSAGASTRPGAPVINARTDVCSRPTSRSRITEAITRLNLPGEGGGRTRPVGATHARGAPLRRRSTPLNVTAHPAKARSRPAWPSTGAWRALRQLRPAAAPLRLHLDEVTACRAASRTGHSNPHHLRTGKPADPARDCDATKDHNPHRDRRPPFLQRSGKREEIVLATKVFGDMARGERRDLSCAEHPPRGRRALQPPAPTTSTSAPRPPARAAG